MIFEMWAVDLNTCISYNHTVVNRNFVVILQITIGIISYIIIYNCVLVIIVKFAYTACNCFLHKFEIVLKL